MMATCNQLMVAQIEKLSGLRFDRSSNIFWPSTDAMHHRNVCLRVAYSTYPPSSFKKRVGPGLETSQLRKCIWYYANNLNTIERYTKMLGSWIDQQGFKPDVASVTGAQMKEHKFHHINLFAATNLPNLPLLETSNNVTQPFNTQIFTATCPLRCHRQCLFQSASNCHECSRLQRFGKSIYAKTRPVT
jgi:hypothetical protein